MNILDALKNCEIKYLWNNIRFNHGFEVFNVCSGPRSILMPDAKRKTESPWLNVIVTHS